MTQTDRTMRTYTRLALLIAILTMTTVFPSRVSATDYPDRAMIHLVSETPDIKWKRQSLGDFKFILPTGNGWRSKRMKDEIRTYREVPERDGIKELHYITVIRNTFPPDRRSWTTKQIADEFRNMEIIGMKTLGVNTGQYQLRSAKLGQEKRSDLTLYTLKNVKKGSPIGAGFNEQQNFYMLFAADYAKTQEFYIVILGNVCFGQPACAISTLSVEGLRPMLTQLSFK